MKQIDGLICNGSSFHVHVLSKFQAFRVSVQCIIIIIIIIILSCLI